MPVITSSRPKPELSTLEKRVPRNPKYEHVQSTLDTGDSVTKFMQRNEEIRASGQQQAGEIFKRMKISTLVKLIIQVVEINSLESTTQRTTMPTVRPETQDSQMSMATSRSTLESVIHGMGEMDVYRRYMKQLETVREEAPVTPKTAHSERSNIDFDERPYMIVDLRDYDEFRANHIISAHHYPAAMLSRCTNNESKELLLYKNQKGKIIVLYDEDERIAPRAATVMVERGYNNVFLLSGGLKYAVRKFPRGLLTGSCPLAWTMTHPPSTSRKLKRSESLDTLHHQTPVGQSTSHGTRPPPGPLVTFPTREEFTAHDVEDLNTQLEANLAPKDSGTRLSRAQTEASKQSSRVSNISDRTHYSHISDKPWKP